MRIISRRPLREFAEKHPHSKASLDAWWAEAKRASWPNFAEIKKRYNSADMVSGNLVIFNISGNHYRLIVKINFQARIGFVKFIGTHAEYDKIDVRKL